ncbi:MAG: hypothetical protein KC503_35445 [Myxococcales bacterium]|nr:hypothetical protein [Myxococcales bacterium]
MKRAALSLCAGALALCACTGEKQTQIIVSVATDLSIPGQIDQLGFNVRYRGAPDDAVDIVWDLDQNRPDAIKLPARIAVSRGVTELSRVIEFHVRALAAGKLVVARRAALPFARDRQLLLRMNLLAQCIPVSCEPNETCGEGGCEKIEKSPDELPDYTPDKERAGQDVGVYDAFGRERLADASADSDAAGDGPHDGALDSDADGAGGDITRDGPLPDGDAAPPSEGGPPPDTAVDGASGSDTYSTRGTSLTRTCGSLVQSLLPLGGYNFSIGLDGAGVPHIFIVAISGLSTYKLVNNVWVLQAALGLGRSNVQDGDATITPDGTIHFVYRVGSNAPNYVQRPSGGNWGTPIVLPFQAPVGSTYKNVRVAAAGDTNRVVAALGADDGGQKRVYHITRNAGVAGAFTDLAALATATQNDGLQLAASARLSASVGGVSGSYEIHGRSLVNTPTAINADTNTSFGGAGVSGPAAIAVDDFQAVVHGFDASGAIVEDFYSVGPGGVTQSCPAMPYFGSPPAVFGSAAVTVLFGRSLAAWLTVPTAPERQLRTAWKLAGIGYAIQLQDQSTGTASPKLVRIVADSARERAYVVYEWAGGPTPTIWGQCYKVNP